MIRSNKPLDALAIGDVFRCSDIGNKIYLVVGTHYSGGGTGHGPHDVYPDGWKISYVEMPEKSLDTSEDGVQLTPEEVDGETPHFYQSGCFTTYIDPKHIEKIGSMERHVTFFWKNFPK